MALMTAACIGGACCRAYTISSLPSDDLILTKLLFEYFVGSFLFSEVTLIPPTRIIDQSYEFSDLRVASNL